MVLVDVVMVGRFSTNELAYASLGASIFIPLLVVGVGLMIGVVATTAQTYGAGRESECAGIWYRSLPFALSVGTISMVICLFGEPLLRLFGQSDLLAREGGKVAMVLAPGLIGYSLFVVSTFFLEGIKRPGPGMVAMLFANLLNIALNWVFIFGNLGMPAMGAVGSGLVTSIVRIFLGVVMVAYILRMRDGARFGVTGWPNRTALIGWWRKSAQARRIGYAGGAGIGSETAAHSILIQFAGLIGILPVAAYSIAANVEAVMFMIALGIGSATAVLVGNAWGRGNVSEARLAGWVGLGATVAAMSLCGILIAVFRAPIASFYSGDPALVAQTTPLLVLVGIVIVADGAQLSLAQSVRGLGDTWAAAGRYALAFLGIMVPLGWVFAIGFDWGAKGLLYAMMIGCLVSLALQGARFAYLLRRGP
jgi:MATE family multidrug resistance protein